MIDWSALHWAYQGFGQIGAFLIDFTFYYPLFMAYVWIIGGVYYYWRFERRSAHLVAPEGTAWPPVSILVPMRNEAAHAGETIEQLLRQQYPDFEILAIDDGSTDDTGAILDTYLGRDGRVRIIHLARNQGKAVALNTAVVLARHEHIVCIDGDALLDEHALRWMMQHFVSGPRVGSVTGNPRVRNRSTLLGKIQVGEFSSIVGLIKRAQRIYGRLFTVSGVICAFRRTALHDVGFFSPEMLTEDIDISWKLQLNHWDIRYEPRALCWILMPETFRGLWRQRLRWAMGGVQVLRQYFGSLGVWRKRRMWMIYFEFMISVVWAYAMALVMVLWALGKFVDLPPEFAIPTLLPGWSGVLIGSTCLLQIAVALLLDGVYDRKLGRVYYWMVWYPLVYWMINMLTTIVALPAVLLRARRMRAVWVSPDRGVNTQ